MGLPKEFDREEVLDKAIEVFRRQGYEATSVRDLVTHMEVRPGSLYDTFGDKHRLFLAALERYEQARTARLSAALEMPGSKKEAIRQALHGMVDALHATGRSGCLLTNTVGECLPRDPQIARLVEANQARTEAVLSAALRQAQADREIGARRDPHVLARYLVGILHALRVMVKTTPDPAALHDLVEVALSALD